MCQFVTEYDPYLQNGKTSPIVSDQIKREKAVPCIFAQIEKES